MDLNAPTLWWIAAGLLVMVELSSGTFYLLMLALGAIAAALAAHLQASLTVQMLSAALVGGSAVTFWHLRQLKSQARHPEAQPSHNPNVLIDIGQTVDVPHWSSNQTTHVQYRGARWQARFVGTQAAQPGRHRICGMEGSCLLLDQA